MNEPFVFSPDWTPITPQRVFDAAWQAFIVEDKLPAAEPTEGRCMYLTEDGRKCAIGLCIPDGHPAQAGPPSGVSGLARSYPGLFPVDLEVQEELRVLQYALHDGLIVTNANDLSVRWRYDKTEREVDYRCVAKKLGLTIPGERS